MRLGLTEAQVAERMGRPLHTSTRCVNYAVIDPRCSAPKAKRGARVYRRVSAAVGADGQVHTLIYKGPTTTPKASASARASPRCG